MDRRIVIGFDGSDHSQDALALGAQLARATRASLVVVDAYYDLPGLPSPLSDQVREDAEGSLREAGHALPDDIPVTKRLLGHRSPARALYEVAEEVDADLIVIGATRSAAPGHAAGGRLARQLLDAAPCAVAIAPAGLHRRADVVLRSIGVGVDGGEDSTHALSAAVELARACDAALLIMAAAEPVTPVISEYGAEADRRTRGLFRAAAERALSAARESAPDDLTVDGALLEDGSVAEMLAERAAAADIDFLVVGSRGFGPLRRVLLGSVSAQLMHDVPCGLVVVPRGARDSGERGTAAAEAVASP
jgi:nucleotide-binding universal stress UspA family protein